MRPRSRNSYLLDQVQPGDEIEVWWPHDAQYYSGVVGTKLPSGRHRIFYNDGEIEDLKLATEQWRFIGVSADRIQSSHPAPSLDPPSDGPQPHQPDSQEQDQLSSDVQPTTPAGSQATATGKKRGRPRGKKSTAKIPKPKPGKPSQTPSSSAANEAQKESKLNSAKPAASSQPTPAPKTKATTVKKRQRSSSTSAQGAKPKPPKSVVLTGAVPSLDGDDGLIDAAPLAPKSVSSPTAPSSAPNAPSLTPATATATATTTTTASPPTLSTAQTNDPKQKPVVVSKPSYTLTLTARTPSVQTKQGTRKGTTSPTPPATIPARNVAPPGKTPAKKSTTATAKSTAATVKSTAATAKNTVATGKSATATAKSTTATAKSPTATAKSTTATAKSTTAAAQDTTTSATIPVRNAATPGKTPAKKSTTTAPQAKPSNAFSTPRSTSNNSQAKMTNRPAFIQKSPGTNGPRSQSDAKKASTSTSVHRKAVPIAPAETAASIDDDTPLITLRASPKASTNARDVAPTAHSKPQNGKETSKTTSAPPKHSPPKAAGKPDAMKGVEMASATTQHKTFILAANGTIREKPPQLSPEVPTPAKEKQGNRTQPKQVKPQSAKGESSTRAVGPKDTTGARQSKMALTAIVSNHKEQNKASPTPTRSDVRTADPPSENSMGQDVTTQATNGLKKRDSVLQTSQKGFAKSKGAKISKPLGVKKVISKPVKTVPSKRIATHALQVSEGSGKPVKPRDGSDIIADVTVPRRSKSGVTSPLLGSPLHTRPSVSSPRKPLPAASGTGSPIKTGSDTKKLAMDQASPKKASLEDHAMQDKGERHGSKLGPFQPTRRRLKSLPGGAAHQGQQQSTAKATHKKPSQHPTVSETERPRPLPEPPKASDQREQIAASEPRGAKTNRHDESSREAPQPSPTSGSNDLQVSQCSAPKRVSSNGGITKAQQPSLPEQKGAQLPSQQPNGGNVVNKTRSKQGMPSVAPVPGASTTMVIDKSPKTGVKRAASEALKIVKRRRPNPPNAVAPNAAVIADSKAEKGKTSTNAINGRGLGTQKETKLAVAADAAIAAASKAQSRGSQAIDSQSTPVSKIAAAQRAGTRDASGPGVQVPPARHDSLPSNTPVSVSQGEKDHPFKNLSAKAPAQAPSKKPHQSHVGENREGSQDSDPSVASPPKSFARVRQRPNAGSSRPSSASRGPVNIPKDASEMSASSAIDAIKQAVREANMESLQPQLAPVVTRIEKCFADSDRRVRSLQGQLDRSTKALESLQQQLQDLKKAISYVPSISEVRSLLDSQSLEMKRATAISMESVVSAVKEDMKKYLPREIKAGMENIAALVQKDSIMMISRAVDSAMASGMLQGFPRAVEPNQADAQQNTNPEPRSGVANEASSRGAVPESVERHFDSNQRRLEESVEIGRAANPSRSTGPSLGASGRGSNKDDPPESVARESPRVPRKVREPQPVLSSNGPTTSSFERNKRVSKPNGNDQSVENRETAEGQNDAQRARTNINSQQNVHSQGAQPPSNGFHPDSSARPDLSPNDRSGGQSSSVRANGPNVAAKSRTVSRGSQPKIPLAKRENYGYVSHRMKSLLARSAVEWFLKGGCRDFAPQNERTSRVSEKWIKDSVQRCLTGLIERLQQEEEFKDAMVTLAHSIGVPIQADWLVKGPTTANINTARKNYVDWDPKLFDFEWESEKRVLAKLSETLLRSEKILMAAGEFLEDPLRTAIQCVEHASKHFSSS